MIQELWTHCWLFIIIFQKKTHFYSTVKVFNSKLSGYAKAFTKYNVKYIIPPTTVSVSNQNEEIF